MNAIRNIPGANYISDVASKLQKGEYKKEALIALKATAALTATAAAAYFVVNNVDGNGFFNTDSSSNSTFNFHNVTFC